MVVQRKHICPQKSLISPAVKKRGGPNITAEIETRSHYLSGLRLCRIPPQPSKQRTASGWQVAATSVQEGAGFSRFPISKRSTHMPADSLPLGSASCLPDHAPTQQSGITTVSTPFPGEPGNWEAGILDHRKNCPSEAPRPQLAPYSWQCSSTPPPGCRILALKDALFGRVALRFRHTKNTQGKNPVIC